MSEPTLKRAKTKEVQLASIEWLVTGRAVFVGATLIVKAKTRQEAMDKANRGENTVREVEIDCASLADFEARRAEPNE